ALAEYAGYTLYQDKGAEIEFVAPPEGMPAIAIYIGVVNKAPHPEAAKLFVDWALSRRGQLVYQNQKILLYGSLRPDAGPMPTGNRLAAVLVLYPIAYLVQASLSVGDPQARPPEAYGLDNYAGLGRYAHIFGNTLLVAALATALAVVVGFTMGWILSRTNVPGRAAFE